MGSKAGFRNATDLINIPCNRRDGLQMSESPSSHPVDSRGNSRRRFLFLMLPWGIVAAAYGTLAALAVRFLFPSQRRRQDWQFVTTTAELTMGQSLTFTSPDGSKIVVARQREGDEQDSFVALSSVCPHLGCAVHWEPHNNRFFCPCHNGAFDAAGEPTSGPPAKAGQPLTRFPLSVDRGRLFIRVPLERVTDSRERTV